MLVAVGGCELDEITLEMILLDTFFMVCWMLTKKRKIGTMLTQRGHVVKSYSWESSTKDSNSIDQLLLKL